MVGLAADMVEEDCREMAERQASLVVITSCVAAIGAATTLKDAQGIRCTAACHMMSRHGILMAIY